MACIIHKNKKYELTISNMFLTINCTRIAPSSIKLLNQLQFCNKKIENSPKSAGNGILKTLF